MGFVIFGAGQVGISAANYYGVENVECFIDNDKNKTGNLLLGKPIITLSEYKKRSEETRIAIALNGINRIRVKKQLEESGIDDYVFFFPSIANGEDIVINNYSDQGDVSEDEWIDEFQKRINLDEIREYVNYLYEANELFCEIEIETINKCNGKCSFCPVSVNSDIRERTLMSDELFKKIIKDLQQDNYRGRICLFSNNEPFLDKDIIKKYRFLRMNLPNAFIHLYSNGSLLDVEKYKEIIPYLDEFIIDNYNDALQLNMNLVEVCDYIRHNDDARRKTVIWLRKENEILTTRGGEALNRNQRVLFPDYPCILPFQQMVVRPDGKVSLCCNDPYGRYTLGDVSKNTPREVWYSNEYQIIRKQIKEGRYKLEKCKYCDTFIGF